MRSSQKRERAFGSNFGCFVCAKLDLLDTPQEGKVYFEIRPLKRFGRYFVLYSPHTQATLAQLVEHSIRNRKVVGSNPTGGSRYRYPPMATINLPVAAL